MFEEIKEMIDSTVYPNGNGEVTAQNINLAMQGIVEATEEKITEVEEMVAGIEENGTCGSGALKVWVNEMAGGENNSEQVAENAETFRAMWNEKPQMAILCAAAELGGFPMMIVQPVDAYRLISEEGTNAISMGYTEIVDEGNGLELMTISIYLNEDGTVTIEYA